MKSLCLLVIASLVWLASAAQKTYFVYLQSENNQSFYIRNGEKIQSSNASGYMILSGLTDSTYTYAIGFPGNIRETRFTIPVSKDRGFLIRTGGEMLNLMDLQALSIMKPASEPARNGGNSYTVRDDAFTRMLARAVKDSSLLLVQVDAAPPADMAEKKEPQKAEQKTEVRTEPVVSAQPITIDSSATVTAMPKEQKVEVKNDPPVVRTTPVTTVEKATAAEKEKEVQVNENTTTQNTGVYSPSVVIRRSESSTTEGFGLVYHDNRNGVVDTIRILIPNPKSPFRSEPKEPARESKAFLEVTTNDTARATSDPAPVITNKKACAKIATEADFLKLRRNMAAADSEDNMMAAATKAFREKCYTTEQVRNLGYLFLNNYGKYRFFSAAFTHVSDVAEFPSLEAEFKDEYYIERFKAFLRQ